MHKARHAAQIENIYFLSRIGATLRWVTQDIGRDELPDEIKRLLGRLERQEAKGRAKSNDPEPGAAS